MSELSDALARTQARWEKLSHDERGPDTWYSILRSELENAKRIEARKGGDPKGLHA